MVSATQWIWSFWRPDNNRVKTQNNPEKLSQ